MEHSPAPRSGDFVSGAQPCAAFSPQQTGFGANRHECFGPYEGARGSAGLRTCHALVSFCENCTRDHHEGGWDHCPAPEIDREPPAGRLE